MNCISYNVLIIFFFLKYFGGSILPWFLQLCTAANLHLAARSKEEGQVFENVGGVRARLSQRVFAG